MIALSLLGAQLLSHRNELEAAGHDVARIEDAYKRFEELERYVYAEDLIELRLKSDQCMLAVLLS